MATYKVSYKLLKQQGEAIKATAKLVDGYSERVSQISGKLGDDDLLKEVRSNLGKLREQLGESRTVLNTAGEILVKAVDSYTGVETSQIKKVEATKAHQRDFYKNPVVVASAGGAAAGGAVAAATTASTPASTTTVNYTDNSVNVNYTATAEPVAAAPAVAAGPEVVNTAVTPTSAPTPAAVPVAEAAKASIGGVAGIAAGAGVVGGAIGAGAVVGVKHLMDEDKKTKAEERKPGNADDGYDPEAELKKAIQRVKDLEEE